MSSQNESEMVKDGANEATPQTDVSNDKNEPQPLETAPEKDQPVTAEEKGKSQEGDDKADKSSSSDVKQEDAAQKSSGSKSEGSRIPNGNDSLPFFTTEADGRVRIRMAESGPGSTPPLLITDVLKNCVEKYGKLPAMAVKRDGQLRTWNWIEYYSDAMLVAKSLLKVST